MTEQEWLACEKPDPILHAVCDEASDRKLRLFACACCRLVWHLLPDLCHRLVVAVERYVGKELGSSDLTSLFSGYYSHEVSSPVSGGKQAAEAVGYLGWNWRWGRNTNKWQESYTAGRVARSAAEALAKSIVWEEARQREVQLLHDIFGNRFRPSKIDKTWLRWNDRTVPRIALGIYEERAFDRMPILADALLDAGCDNEELLTHCRSPGPHVRGCWAVDLLLGEA